MDSSALESEISRLDARSKSLEHWLSFWIWLVVIGLVLEIGMVLVNYFNPLVPWPKLKLFLDLMGPVLIAAGVAGELGIHFKAGNVNSDLQGFRNQVSDILKTVAAQALDRATKAEQAAAEANLARVKLEQRMKPRWIDDEGSDKLKGLLAAYPKMGIDIVMFEHHMPETQFVFTQLLDVFISVGWHCRVWESRRAKHRIPGPSVIFAVAAGYEERLIALARAMA